MEETKVIVEELSRHLSDLVMTLYILLMLTVTDLQINQNQQLTSLEIVTLN